MSHARLNQQQTSLASNVKVINELKYTRALRNYHNANANYSNRNVNTNNDGGAGGGAGAEQQGRLLSFYMNHSANYSGLNYKADPSDAPH